MIVDNEISSDKFGDNNTNTFSFYEKDFEVLNKNGKYTYKYFMIYKIFETHNFYYIYISKENAFLVSKHAFSIGNEVDFSSFMKSKCHFKYKTHN